MELKGKAAAFFDGSDVKLIYIEDSDQNKLKARTETGRQFKIPVKNIVCPVKSLTYEEFTSQSSGLMEEIYSLSKTIETELLWEMVADTQEYSSEDLSENYFGCSDPLQVCSMFVALVEDYIHFKRKGLLFINRNEEQVKERKTALIRKREKEEFREKALPWIKEIIKADEVGEIPSQFKQFLNQLEVYLTNRKPNEASQLLAAATGEGSLKEMVYEILLKCDVIDKSKDRFLLLAGIDEQFSNRILEEAENFDCNHGNEKRIDYTGILTFSIDDEDTLDIDDALSLERLDNGGFKVGIHITDVSAYIEKNDILDREASKRVTSIYLPTGTVHMFPPALAQKKLSLTEGDVRPAMSFFVCFDSDFQIAESSVELTEVRVDRKLSYESTDKLLQNDSDLSEVLDTLYQISLSLKKQRIEKGAAIFNRPEIKIRAENSRMFILADKSEYGNIVRFIRLSDLRRAAISQSAKMNLPHLLIK